MTAGRGLTATELAAAVDELQALCSATVLDVQTVVSKPADHDLLLVLQREQGRKHFLHVALGSSRARICTTARRFRREDYGKGPASDRLQQGLLNTRLLAVEHKAGERRAELRFAAPNEFAERRLVVELFSARGLWALLDDDGKAVALSRPVETAVRTLRIGDRYTTPPARADGKQPEEPPRFDAPVLAAIDAHFTAADGLAASGDEHEQLLRAAERALKKASAKVAGLGKQLAAADDTASLRQRADLMLAYAHSVKRGASAMEVAHPETGEPLTLELDPKKPVHAQAEALYDKARRLEDGRAITVGRHAEAGSQVQDLTAILADLQTVEPGAEGSGERLDAARTKLGELGALPRSKQPKPGGKDKKKPSTPPGENFRRFVSAEGYQILVGRNNQQNDRLTMRVANGNDLWLHVGGGRPGSHVVVRLPKQKTASLESLLDAATLAVHFSKARGQRRIDVVYCLKKFVKKPKGLPAGAVVPSQTKTIAVDHDEGRLKRLLDSAPDGDD